jgi:hypothetical protein
MKGQLSIPQPREGFTIKIYIAYEQGTPGLKSKSSKCLEQKVNLISQPTLPITNYQFLNYKKNQQI